MAKSIVTFIQATNRRRLPVQPGIFTGDILQFANWNTEFKVYIEEKSTTEVESTAESFSKSIKRAC